MTNAMTVKPIVSLQQGRAMTSTSDVGELFGRLHKNVLQGIQNLECSPEFRRLNFQLTSVNVQMPRGGFRKEDAYDMTKDGFTFLAMGFTGPLAARFKEAYIARFNELEASRGEAHWIEGQQACGVAHLPHERIPLT